MPTRRQPRRRERSREAGLTSVPSRKARRFEAESLAAGGAQRDQKPERKHLPCRRVAYLQDRPGDAFERGRQPTGSRKCGFVRTTQSVTPDAGYMPQEQIARPLIRSLALNAVVGHVLAGPHQRLTVDKQSNATKLFMYASFRLGG
jgi:hypothetical protein